MLDLRNPTEDEAKELHQIFEKHPDMDWDFAVVTLSNKTVWQYRSMAYLMGTYRWFPLTPPSNLTQ